MVEVDVSDKYAAPEVVSFWREMSVLGLQRSETEIISRYVPHGSRIIDLGCGGGRVALALDPARYTVVGLDLTWEMLRTAQDLLRQAGRAARLVQGDLCAIPCHDGAFGAALVLVAAIQHVPDRVSRQRAFGEIARALAPGGTLVLAIDNIAPSLGCYAWWAMRKLTLLVTSGAVRPDSLNQATAADRRVAGHPDGIRLVVWHARGLLRSVRWRTWPMVVDACRRFGITTGEVGDISISQVAVPSTPGRVPYHLFNRQELLEDTARGGLISVAERSYGELRTGRTCPPWVRARDKQVFYVFQKPPASD